MNCILNDIATCDLIFYFSYYVFTLLLLPCEQRFLSCMAFSVYEVTCVVRLFTPREKPLQQAAWDFR